MSRVLVTDRDSSVDMWEKEHLECYAISSKLIIKAGH